MSTPWFRELPLDFSRPQTRAAEEIVVEAYALPAELVMLAQNAGIKTATLNLNAPNQQIFVRDLFSKARAAGRLLRLLAEVMNDPNRADFGKRLAELVEGHEAEFANAILLHKPSVALLAAAPPDGQLQLANEPAVPLAKGLEKTINRAAGTIDTAKFRAGLARAELRTARVSVGGKVKGTGFLVADSLLMTNWHVVAGITPGLTGIAQFDYKRDAAEVLSDGREVKFAENWLVAKSEHYVVADELGADGPGGGRWDYALVRLAEPVANQTIGPNPAAPGEQRGSFRLDGMRYTFDGQEPILIVGHPDKLPMQLAYASPGGARLTKQSTRVRYQTNTEPGSSGSPVFNKDWRLVVLHHAGGPTSVPGTLAVADGTFNQGIAIADVVADLLTKVDSGVRSELGLG